MFSNLYSTLMDPERNGLRKIPKAQRFQLMLTLSFMWSIIFCAMAGIMVWLPGYILIHIALIFIGLFGTGWTFKESSKR